jgi:hypothetical protein
MKSLLDMVWLMPRHRNNSTTLKGAALDEYTSMSKWKGNQDEGLLQLWLNTSAPFELEDYKPLYSVYELDLDNQTLASSQFQMDKKEWQARRNRDQRSDDPPRRGRPAFSFFNRSNRSGELASNSSFVSNNILKTMKTQLACHWIPSHIKTIWI